MQNVTIRRFINTDHYAITIEPADHMWQLKVQQDGTPRLFLGTKQPYPATHEGVYDEAVGHPDAYYTYRECAEMGYLRRVAWLLGKPPKFNEPEKLSEDLINSVQAELRAHYVELGNSSGAVCALVSALRERGQPTDGAVNDLAARVIALLPAVERDPVVDPFTNERRSDLERQAAMPKTNMVRGITLTSETA